MAEPAPAPDQPPDLLGRGLRLLSDLAPSAVARIAERAAFLPPRHRRPAREWQWLATAETFAVPFRSGHLTAWAWGRGPTVLLVHGWAGRGSQLGAFAAPLVDAGFRAVAFDAPAHGGSSGRSLDLPRYADAIEEVAWAEGPLAGIVAHSMGAMAAALAASRGMPVGRLTLVATACFDRRFVEALARGVGLGPRAFAAFQRRHEARCGLGWEELAVERVAPRLTMPTLFVHDRGDRELALERAERFASLAPGAHLWRTSGLGHRRILRDPAVVAGVTAWQRGRGFGAPSSSDPWEELLRHEPVLPRTG